MNIYASYFKFLLFNLVFIGLICGCCGVAQDPEKEYKNSHTSYDNTFSWSDYLVLGTMLVVSCGVGVFYGFFGKQEKSSDDFLLGGSSMGTFPMAMSLAASFVTAIELLGNPSEMYFHGLQFWTICIAFILVVPITSKFYLPVFMDLRLTSSYEYFSLRFNSTTRYLASALYILQMVLYTSVAVYAPALALSKVTGLNVYVAVSVVYLVCIFYASQGGMKAVIIADTFQAVILIASLIAIACIGEKYLGPDAEIWLDNYKTDRLGILDMNPSLTVRHSFWSVTIGGTFYWMTMFCSNQASIQKYLSVKSISQVKVALWTSSFGLIIIYSLNFYTGMIMVSKYKECDPLLSKRINATDELLPFYVITEMGHLKGITGFFVAGIFAASLGTVASALNSLSAVTMEDFIAGALGVEIPKNKGAFWVKCISIAYGAVGFLLVFIVSKLGSVMQVAISFNGMVGGVTLGLFSLGMFFPWANAKGATFGSAVATALITLMCIGQQISISDGSYNEKIKFTTIQGCENNSTNIISSFNVEYEEEIEDVGFFLYRVSYIWYSALGCLITVFVGMLGSYVTGFENPSVKKSLLSPPVRSFLNFNKEENVESGVIKGAIKGFVNVTLDLNESKVDIKERHMVY